MVFRPFISISNFYQHILLFFGKKAKINRNGRIFWYENGCLHRLDGPAAESYGGVKGGAKEWYKNGKLHREDGPAVETFRGNKFWYQSGKLHRINGPAVISANGKKEWHIRGREFKNKEEFFLNLNKEEKKQALFSEDFLNG
jgi:hypothetical protein